jgi:DMSO/TMAO reductase YedYZ heme-binding membrane subunit
MTATSFSLARKPLSNRQWKALHKFGIYYLWAYAFSVYWYELFYYEAPEPID